jgi:hypothetical protein
MTLRPFQARALALILPVTVLLAVAGCSNKPVPPCPNVRVDSSTGSLTRFKDGPGRDVTDVQYQAEIVGYKGQCVHHEDSVDVVVDVDFRLTGGPAAQGGYADIYYFIAIPQFFPQPAGKRVFGVDTKVPQKAGEQIRFTESGVRITIPLKKDQPAASFDIYTGFQLEPAQLDYNRSRAQK